MSESVDHPEGGGPDPRITMEPLPRILVQHQEEALTLKTAVDALNAKFAAGTDEANTERQKVQKLIEMILQQHLKCAAGAVKMLVLGLVENKAKEAVEVLKAHLMQIESARNGLTMVRAKFAGDLPDQEKQIITATEAEMNARGLRLKKGGKAKR